MSSPCSTRTRSPSPRHRSVLPPVRANERRCVALLAGALSLSCATWSTTARAQGASAQGASAQGATALGATAWIDVDGATVRQPKGASRAAGTLALGGQVRGRWFTLQGDGATTVAADSVGATQAVLRAQLAPRAWTLSEFEASATSIGITLPGTRGNRSLAFRQSIRVGDLRVFAGAGNGHTSRYALDSRSGAQHVGVGGTHGAWSSSLTLQRATTDDWQLMEASGFVLTRSAPTYGLHDATLDVAWQWRRVALGASRAWRAGVGATHGTASGYALSAAWRVADPLTLVVQSGRQLADVLRGVPQATYSGVGMRWQLGRAATAGNARRDRSPYDVIPGAEYRLEPRDGGADLVLTLRAAPDAIVEWSSSVGDWAAQRLVRSGETYTARLALPSGAHRLAVRVNGGPWRAPRGLARVSDDFGGSAGVIVVP